MQKLPQLQFDHYYHIYNRGINQQNIFFEERNYAFFLKRYASYIEPVADTFAYCLLKNHFHFLVRIKTEEEQKVFFKTNQVSESQTSQVFKTWEVLNPTQQFSNLFNSYAKAINKTYERTGSLFQKRFGRIPVDSDEYFTHLITYIHHNPQKHGFVRDFRDYPHSSYHTLLSKKETRLKRGEVLGWFDGLKFFVHAHQITPDKGIIAHLVGDDFD